MTDASKEGWKMIMDRVPCIYYPIKFRKDKRLTIRALINLGSKINAMTLAYAKPLSLQGQKIDVGAQKIDGSLVKTFEIVITSFQVKNKLSRARFF